MPIALPLGLAKRCECSFRRVGRIRSQSQTFPSVIGSISIRALEEGVASDTLLIRIAEFIAAQVGNCAYRIAALESHTLECFPTKARNHVAR